jgi:uncharacterized protein (DUF302 family)
MTQAEGLISVESAFAPAETMDRLEEGVKALGMTVFARIDHAAGAAQAGMQLRPTELLIFGNPKAGTPLMQAGQAIGIDLPLKALVWRDETGATRIAWNDPEWLVRRHRLGGETAAVAARMSAALKTTAAKAAGLEGA